MSFYDHSLRPTKETRADKYGQVIRLKCKCGIVTNWHTDLWKAEQALYDIHADPYKGATIAEVKAMIEKT